MQDDIKRANDYIQKHGAQCVAVFDIGTKGVRLLLAPKITPNRWSREDFVLIGVETNLGLAFDEPTKTLQINSKQWQKTMSFVKKHTDNLQSESINDISIIGTAIFRWSNNRDILRNTIKDSTGVSMEILTAKYEADLSILGMIPIYECGGLKIQPNEDDTLLMINQGGGSLEISWLQWSQRHAQDPDVSTHTFEDLGINALTKMTHTGIDVLAYSSNLLANTALPLQQKSGPQVYIFGMGSVLTNAIKKTGFKAHNKIMSLANIKEKIHACTTDIISIPTELQTIKMPHKKRLKLERRLSKSKGGLLGLPIFQKIMQLCNVGHLTINGTGLIFQYYLSKHKKIATS